MARTTIDSPVENDVHVTDADGTEAVCGVNIAVKSGEFIRYRGLNEAGETTLNDVSLAFTSNHVDRDFAVDIESVESAAVEVRL